MALIPTVITKTIDGERSFDLLSRLMQDRIIYVSGEVNNAMADIICGQLLHLEAEDPNKEICLYIDSPGGCVHSGLAIVDTMNYIKCDVRTIAMGLAASMGLYITANGTPGKRCALPHASLMLHEISAGNQGKYHDMEASMNHSKELNNLLLEEMYNRLNESYKENVSLDNFKMIARTDYWMNPKQALEIGFIDEIVENR
jgi:ATP-dependent Clp protease protease subunit